MKSTNVMQVASRVNASVLDNGFSRLQTWLAFAMLWMGVFARNACAEKVGWHPQMADIAPGRGFDWYDQTKLKPPVAVMPTNPTPCSGTGDASMTVTFAQHQFDLVKSFSLNASGSMQETVFHGKVGFNFVDNHSFSQNTLTFAFVCNRNFGDCVLVPLSLSPEFVNRVKTFKKTLSGPALLQKVTESYGTHFVSGYSSSASVYVIYTLSFASASLAQSLSANIEANFHGVLTSGEFESQVQSALQQKDSSASLSYTFYTTDSIKPNFQSVDQITNYTTFLEFNQKLTDYCNKMNPNHFKKTQYIVEPLQNLPGFTELIGYSPATEFDTSYEKFMQIYGQLRNWDAMLSGWTIDPRRMSWLNAKGKSQVVTMRKNVENYLRTLEQMAKDYFSKGTPLKVPDDALDYIASFSRIEIPTIYVINTTVAEISPSAPPGTLNRQVIGYVYCGDKDITVTNPFSSVAMFKDKVDVGKICHVYYTPEEFERYLTADAARSTFSGYKNLVQGAFSNRAWASLKQQAETKRLIFFTQGQPASEESRWSWVIRDNAGQKVDELSFRSSRSAGTLGPDASKQ